MQYCLRGLNSDSFSSIDCLGEAVTIDRRNSCSGMQIMCQQQAKIAAWLRAFSAARNSCGFPGTASLGTAQVHTLQSGHGTCAHPSFAAHSGTGGSAHGPLSWTPCVHDAAGFLGGRHPRTQALPLMEKAGAIQGPPSCPAAPYSCQAVGCCSRHAAAQLARRFPSPTRRRSCSLAAASPQPFQWHPAHCPQAPCAP